MYVRVTYTPQIVHDKMSEDGILLTLEERLITVGCYTFGHQTLHISTLLASVATEKLQYANYIQLY